MIRKLLSNNEKRALPKNYKTSDIYLVSYPKSGNTWLRFLLANSIKLSYSIQRDVNFFSIQDIIPGLGSHNVIADTGPFGIPELPRILTTHASYNSLIDRLIFLVRDPVDVMISYYRHSLSYNMIDENMELNEFIRHEKYGICNWCDHTISWLDMNNKKQGHKRFYLIKYEDMVSNTPKILMQLLDLLGIKYDDTLVKKAVMNSSRKNMRESEQLHLNHFYRNSSNNLSFVKNHNDEGKDKYLNSIDINYIEKKASNVIERLDYKVN